MPEISEYLWMCQKLYVSIDNQISTYIKYRLSLGLNLRMSDIWNSIV